MHDLSCAEPSARTSAQGLLFISGLSKNKLLKLESLGFFGLRYNILVIKSQQCNTNTIQAV